MRSTPRALQLAGVVGELVGRGVVLEAVAHQLRQAGVGLRDDQHARRPAPGSAARRWPPSRPVRGRSWRRPRRRRARPALVTASAGRTPIIVRRLVSKLRVAMTGTSGTHRRAASTAASTSPRSLIVSIRTTSIPPSRRATSCSSKSSWACAGSMVPSGASSSPVGPRSPATRTPCRRATSVAIAAPARFSSWTPVRQAVHLQPRAGAAEGVGGEDAGAGLRVLLVEPGDDVGPLDVPELARRRRRRGPAPGAGCPCRRRAAPCRPRRGGCAGGSLRRPGGPERVEVRRQRLGRPLLLQLGDDAVADVGGRCPRPPSSPRGSTRRGTRRCRWPRAAWPPRRSPPGTGAPAGSWSRRRPRARRPAKAGRASRSPGTRSRGEVSACPRPAALSESGETAGGATRSGRLSGDRSGATRVICGRTTSLEEPPCPSPPPRSTPRCWTPPSRGASPSRPSTSRPRRP